MSITNDGAPELVPEQINELSRQFWNSAVLRAGIKLGVFPLLHHQSLSAAQCGLGHIKVDTFGKQNLHTLLVMK